MSTHPPFTKRNLSAISDSVTEGYANTILTTINDHNLHLAVMTGEYRWHFHEHTDELFIVLEGELKIEFEGEVIVLGPGDFMTVPAGVKHKTSAHGRTVNLTIERGKNDTIFIE